MKYKHRTMLLYFISQKQYRRLYDFILIDDQHTQDILEKRILKYLYIEQWC